MEEGSHRCGGASGNTSHYGVNCSSGDVVGRPQRSTSRGVSNNTFTHTQKADTHTEETERTSGHVPPAWRKSSSLHTVQTRGGGVPSWMCNLHASLPHWERMEDTVESEERAIQVLR